MSEVQPANPRRRRLPVTLRWRVVAILIACLVLSCGAVAFVTTVALRHFLVNRLDQQLTQAGVRYATSLEHPNVDGDPDDNAFQSTIGQPSGTLGARVARGRVTAFGVVGDRGATGSAETRSALVGLAAGSHPRTMHLDDLGEYRVLAARGRDGDVLITGLPEHSVDETLRHLLEIEAVVFASALVVAAAIGTGLVRIALRPLTRVARTALQVSNLPLASGAVSIPDRVEDPAPGTEVGQVAEAFNHMLEHVESALTARQGSEERLRRFVADASHELRTPLAVVRSHAEYAQRVGEGTSIEVRNALDRIVAESDRMSSLVDDLLLLARLDSGRPLATAPVDLTRVTLDAVRDAQVAGAEHRWRLELPDEPVVVHGDEHALHQALANLLANARTHTPPGTTVTTTIRTTGTQAELMVADDGPGIPRELLPRVFERLVHGESTRGSGGNGGLGLAIVAAIVSAQGGTVSVDSEPGHTAFRLVLPSFAG
jgi:two-component system OmpR family sensor kinase